MPTKHVCEQLFMSRHSRGIGTIDSVRCSRCTRGFVSIFRIAETQEERQESAPSLLDAVAPGVAIPRIYRSALGYGVGCGEIPSPQLGYHLFPKTQLLQMLEPMLRPRLSHLQPPGPSKDAICTKVLAIRCAGLAGVHGGPSLSL